MLWTRLRAQALLLFAGVASLYAALSPFAIAHQGYNAENIAACRQLLHPNGPRVPPAFGVDWPRNGSTELAVQCPFLALGAAAGRTLGRTANWAERFVAMQPVLATAALVTVVFLWASRLSGSRRAGLLWALAAGFGTMLWPYAYIGLETTQSAFLLAAGYLALGLPPGPSWKRTIAFALFAAIAVSAKSGGVALVPAAGFLAWTMLRRDPLKLATAAIVIGAAFAVNSHFAALSWARWGGVRYWTGVTRQHDAVSSLSSAVALLSSPNKGLIVYAPLAIVGLAVIHRVFRRDRTLAVFAFLALAGPLALVTQFRPWADETWGPRYLLCAVAPLVLCLASTLRGRPFSGLLRAGVLVAAVAGLAVSALGALFPYGTLTAVARRSTPLSLQALQGDPTWNHVAFNARLLKKWLTGRPATIPAPEPWGTVNPRKLDWVDVDLTGWAVPQPVLLRGLAADDPLRPIRPACALLLVAGPLFLLAAARGATRSDAAAREAAALPVPAPAPTPPARAPDPARTSSPEAAFDAIVRGLGFDSEHPGWFPALRDLHRHSREKRLQVVPDFFYTPVFSPKDLPASVWDDTFPSCGTFDLEAQRVFLGETPAFREALQALPVDPPPADDSVYHWNNEQFSHADAALYYTLIRRFRPKRIVEVGSGHSTKLARRALRDIGGGSIVCIEPHPPAWLQSVEGELDIRRMSVQEAPDSTFLSLEPSDILFIDGSHISKTGSDVNHLFLRILPRLPAGVLVQIHDICLPYEYQRYWSEEALCYWNEQYVLAALLANSSKFEILVGVHFLEKRSPEILRAFIPDLPGVMAGGGSLWLRSLA